MEQLTIDLFEPGMGPLHRAGLGGLAATIQWLNEARIDVDRKPSGKLSYDDRTVALSWDSPRDAGPFLQKLYALAFDLRDGLIHLPGSYRSKNEPDEPVKAALQQGMSQTILQFGPNRKALGPPKVGQYEAGEGKAIRYQHQNLVNYTNRSAWQDLVTSKGVLRPWASISGTIAPGFVQRHVAFPATTIEQPPGHAIALHFALVGTLSLSLGPKGGVLIVPDVEDLKQFARRRASFNPSDPKTCRISSPADAALQAMVRLHKERVKESSGVSRCLAVLFKSQKKQTDRT
jgi:CRISPR-associated protein Cas8a1/Csx13